MAGDGVTVDLDALSTFAGNLDSIRTRMDAARDWAHEFDGQMGAAEVEDALHSFESGWKDGRTRIDGNAKALSDMAANAVSSFQSTDQQLSQQLTQATAGDPGWTVAGGRRAE